MKMESSAVSLPMFTVDSFTSKPFSGNPAAVCLDNTPTGISADIMQKIAMEMNISETAFVRCDSSESTFSTGSRFSLKWFTPTREVPLCGHGTLASAAVLFFCMGNTNQELIFDTLSGELTAIREDNFISLDLPLNPPESCQDISEWQPLLELLSLDSTNDIKEILYSSKTKKLLVRLHDKFTRSYLEQLKPEVDRFICTRDKGDLTGIIVTLKADPASGSVSDSGRPYDFISRYFAPWNGIPEDPVTGAAHTVLAGYWSQQLGGKSVMFARQCSKRGGDLLLTLKDGGRLGVAGPATVVFRGHVTIS